MPSIKERIAALQELLQTGRPDFFDLPMEELDPISRSIVEEVRELEALDTAEKMDAYCREHNTTPESVAGIIRLLRTTRYDG